MSIRLSLSTVRASPALWIFLIAFAARLIVLIQLSHSLHFLPESDDMKFYSDWGVRISKGQLTDYQAFYGLPGYAYLLGAVYKLAGGVDPFLVGLLQAALDAGVAVLIFLISRRAFASASSPESLPSGLARPEFVGYAAAFGWIFFTPVQAFSAILMPTIWLVFAYYLGIFFILKTETSSWWKPWFGLGLLCGVVAVMVATILFLIPLLLLAIFLTVDKGQPLLRRLPKMALAVMVVISAIYLGTAPAWIHNYFVAREPVMLSAHSGINFWIGNNPTSTGYPKMPPGIRSTQEGLLKDSITLAEEAVGHKMKRYEVSKYWSARANAYIAEHRIAWLRLMGVKFENFWNAYQYDDLSIIKLLKDEGILLPGIGYGFVAALGLAGLIPCVIRFPRSRWVAAAVLLHMGAVLTVFVTERYRLAAVPGLLVLAAAGLWQFAGWLTARRWVPAVSYAAIAIGAAWYVSIPRPDTSLWALDQYKAGIRATAAGDFDRAQRNLEAAFSYVQDNADINFALGNLWLEKSRHSTEAKEPRLFRAKAALYYQRTLKIDPNRASPFNNLGVLALDDRRFDLAERFFLSALKIEPQVAKTYFLLARTQFEAGKRPEATKSIAQALELRPEQPEFIELQKQIAAPSTLPAPAP